MTCQVSYYTSQLQAWHTYCPIGTQIGLVTNHVLEICYSFDESHDKIILQSESILYSV